MAVGPNTIRAQLKASADNFNDGTLTLAAAKVKLGYVQLAGNNTFLDDLFDEGSAIPVPFLVIGPASKEGEEDANVFIKEYTINCRIWFGFPQNDDRSLEVIEAFVDALADRWRAGTGMTGITPPTAVGWGVPEVNAEKDPVVVFYDLEVNAKGC